MPSLFIDVSENATEQQIKDQTFTYVLVLCIIFGSLTILNVIFFKSRPNDSYKNPNTGNKIESSKDSSDNYQKVQEGSKNVDIFKETNNTKERPYTLKDSVDMIKV